MANSPSNPQIVSIDIRPTPQKGGHIENQTEKDLQIISPKDIGSLNRKQFVAFTLEQIGALTTKQIVAIKPSQIAVFDKSEIQAFSPDQMAAFTSQQLARLTLDQIGALTGAQIIELQKTGKVASLNKKQGARLKRRFSELAIRQFCEVIDPRPHPLSMWSEKPGSTETAGYTSWASLTDRSFFGRHLPSATKTYSNKLPYEGPYECAHQYGDVTALFKRGRFKGSRSSLLFSYFAQWFTDSFLRTDPTDRRKNTSNHQIDMCQIYGLTEETTRILRSMTDGKLKVHKAKGEEFPPLLFDKNGNVNQEFEELPYVKDGRYQRFLNRFGDGEKRKPHYFATGLEIGNSNFGYTALSTLFIRDHNRICDKLRKKNPKWNDERLFQTARMIVILKVIKIVVEEYINHISAPPGGQRYFVFDNSFAEDQNWYRKNWVAAEFDLLYRWHSLVPDTVKVGSKTYGPKELLFNNEPLLKKGGLGAILRAATKQQAGRIGLSNTPVFLLAAEAAAIRMSRDFKLRSYNDYCRHFKLQPKLSIDALTSNKVTRKKLKTLYGTIENVEFLPGLYAEDPGPGKLFGDLMTRMVGCDAFSQALTNPLLSRTIFNKKTLTELGIKEIEGTHNLQDILEDNQQTGKPKAKKPVGISMDFK